MMNKEVTLFINNLYAGYRPSIDEFVSVLGDIFPLLRELKNTEQDEIWHAEGNVHIHTGMVLNELYKIIDGNTKYSNKRLTPDNKVSLILAALFHDISKPTNTRAEFKDRENRVCIVAKNHEYDGRNYLIFRLLELGLTAQVYNDVLSLVAYHQVPKLLVIKNATKGDYIKHICTCNYKLMYILEVADMLGRTCGDLDKQLEYLEMYKMFCDEYCTLEYGHYAYVPSNTYVRDVGAHLLMNNKIYTSEEAESALYEHKNEHSKVVVMCGLPGSGKSSIVHSNYSGYNIISLDEIRKDLNDKYYNNTAEVISIAKELLKKYLRNKENIVYDATNYRKDFRSKIFKLCNDYNAHVSIHMVLKTLDNTIKDDLNRKRPVEKEYILKQHDNFQFPEIEEYHNLVIDIRR